MFNEKNFHKDPPIINLAILKLTNQCNLSCDECNKLFCPTCFKSNNSNDSSFTIDKIKNLIHNLKFYGYKNIALTGGEAYLCKDFFSIYEFISKSKINLTINTNGLIKFEKISTDTCICISLLNKINLDKIIANFKQFKNVILLDFDKLSTEDRSKLPTHWILKHATKNKTCVNKNNLVSTNIENFFTHRDKNYCLNSKISILENGDVYPCLGAYNKVDKIGNIF